MCGIIARFGRPGAPPFDIARQLAALHHRGPDAQGAIGWNPGEADVGSTDPTIAVRRHILGHVRLSIIDLSHAGDQPFVSDDGRYAFSYNGELYNYIELRGELEQAGHQFATTSDTEVLFKALIHWGPACLERLEGMFAFLLVDRHTNSALFARDAFGIKPLYLLRRPDEVLFCSEIAPLLDRQPDLAYDCDSVAHVLRWGADESHEQTLAKGITRAKPGVCYAIDLDTLAVREQATFFDIAAIEEQDWSFDEARVAVRDAFVASVDHHMRSDAALGFSLSGGIDSSAIVCAAHALGRAPLKTFSYVPRDARLSERHWAQLVIDHVGADATFIEPSAAEVESHLSYVVRMQGEPFGSLSIFAQNEVYRRVAEHGVKVILNGQGADEMLAGYNSYYLPLLLQHLRAGRFGALARTARVMQDVNGTSAVATARWLARALLPSRVKERAGRSFLRQKAPWLGVDSMIASGLGSVVDLRGAPGGDNLKDALKFSVGHSLVSLLRYDDRNSMSHSVESRVPFLTPTLARLFLSLPTDFLISRDGVTKHIFREAMRGIVPDAILDRRDKVAFAPDNGNWKQAVSGLVPVAPCSPGLSGMIDQAAFRKAFDRQLGRDNDDQFALMWSTANLLMFDQLHRAA